MLIFKVILLVLSFLESKACLLCLQRMTRRQEVASPRAILAAPVMIDQLMDLSKAKLRSRRYRRGGGEVYFMKSDDQEDFFGPISYSGSGDGAKDDSSDFEQEEGGGGDDDEEEGLQKFMLDSIRWYKSTLSPLMQPNCRFLPTCSSYGLTSIKKFGPVKGGILTAWRILRCTPIGGSGYDAPQWPPPGYRAGSNTKNWF